MSATIHITKPLALLFNYKRQKPLCWSHRLVSIDASTPSVSLRSFSSLPLPSVIYSNHHICVMNKPAGWHSTPNDNDRNSDKCLLLWCKENQLGGGSNNRFLLPLHRIDQPCTGVLVLAKTSKAASRITNQWKSGNVVKAYTCILPNNSMSALRKHSKRITGSKYYQYELSGLLTKKRKPLTKQQGGGWSVDMISWIDYQIKHKTSTPPPGTRLCRIQWRLVNQNDSHFAVVRIKTTSGARHMVRALLAQVAQCPIVGDTRYGSPNTRLPDSSVALHAHEVAFGPSLKLGGLDCRHFVAPLPETWKDYFDVDNDDQEPENVQ